VDVVRVEETVTSPLTVSETWRRVSDVRTWSSWDPGVLAVQRLSGDGGEDTRYLVWVWAGMVPTPMRYRVLVADPESRLVLEGAGGAIRAVDDIRFTDTGAGSMVHWRADLSLRGPLGPFSKLMVPVFRAVGRSAMSGLALHLTV
jgi:carbon monoxide dehydrogenase subunit G